MVGIRAHRKAERPGQILEAAFEEFVLKGYSATRLEDVAKRVGVTKGTIYFYFSSKERLFEEAIHNVGSLPLAAFNRNPTPFTGDIDEDLRVFLRDLYGFIDANPRARETLRLLVAEAPKFPRAVDAYFASFMDPVIDRMRSRLAQATAAGQIRQDVPYGAEAIASPPLAYMIMSLLFRDRRGVDAGQLHHSQVELLLGGLHPPISPDGSDTNRFRAWSVWRAAPDPRTGGLVTAPVGAGLYELRLAMGELLLIGCARNVAARLAGVLSALFSPRVRRSDPDGRFLAANARHLEYRTQACASYGEAQRIVANAEPGRHRFVSGAVVPAPRAGEAQ